MTVADLRSRFVLTKQQEELASLQATFAKSAVFKAFVDRYVEGMQRTLLIFAGVTLIYPSQPYP